MQRDEREETVMGKTSEFPRNVIDGRETVLQETDEVLREVRAERVRQMDKWGWMRDNESADSDPLGTAHDDAHSPGDWTRFIVRHLGRAEQAVEDRGYADDEWERQMVRVAALAVAAVEARRRTVRA